MNAIHGNQKALAALLFALSISLLGASAAKAATPDPEVQRTYDRVVTAIQSADREAILTNATPQMHEALTAQVMANLAGDQGRRLKAEHEATYLTDLTQRGHRIHLWKLTFKDGGDDIILRLVLDANGKLAGVFFQ